MGKKLSGKIRLRSSNGLDRDYYANFQTNEEIGGSGGSNTPADAGSVNYSDTGSYSDGSVGAKLLDLSQKVGVLDDLETTAKSDLVSAINEAAQSGGSGGGYVKPTDGIPATDLTQSLQTSISRADEIYTDYIDAQNLI